jgi:hypothetical protein
MKSLYYTRALLSALVSCGVCLSGCSPSEKCQEEEPSQHTEYRLSSDDKSRIPFTGTDTLIFVSNLGDTAVLYAEGKEQYMETVSSNRNTDPGCPFFDYAYYEHIGFSWKGLHPRFRKLRHSYFAKGESFYNQAYLDNEEVGFSGLEYANRESAYTENILINGTNYKAVSLIPRANDTAGAILYNYHFGILKIRQQNGTQWTRKL